MNNSVVVQSCTLIVNSNEATVMIPQFVVPSPTATQKTMGNIFLSLNLTQRVKEILLNDKFGIVFIQSKAQSKAMRHVEIGQDAILYYIKLYIRPYIILY